MSDAVENLKITFREYVVMASIFVGAPIGVFYGGQANAGVSNRVTRIDSNGTLASLTNSAGTARRAVSGIAIRQVGVFYGGIVSNAVNTVTRLDYDGSLVSNEQAVGSGRYAIAAGRASNLGLFWGGIVSASNHSNRLTRIQSTGVIYGAESTVGGGAEGRTGASVRTMLAIFHGMVISGSATSRTYTMNSSGSTVKTGSAGSARVYTAGTQGFESQALFYGGVNSGVPMNVLSRINLDIVLVGSESNIGSARSLFAGANVGDPCVFYGGQGNLSTVTRISLSGAMVGSETDITPGVGMNAAAAISNEITEVTGNVVVNGSRVEMVNVSGSIVWDAPVRAEYPYGMVYGGNTAYGASDPIYTRLTRFRYTSSLAAERQVGPTRQHVSGAGADTVGTFYGGADPSTDPAPVDYSALLMRVNDYASVISQGNTSQPVAPNRMGGANLLNHAFFYGSLLTRRFSSAGTLVSHASNVGTDRVITGGGLDRSIQSSSTVSAMFIGYVLQPTEAITLTVYNEICTRFNGLGNTVGSEVSATSGTYGAGVAASGGAFVFFGGRANNNSYSKDGNADVVDNRVRRRNPDGTLLGGDLYLGTSRGSTTGITMGLNDACFHGGGNATGIYGSWTSLVTRLNNAGANLVAEGYVGSGRMSSAGASL